MNSIIIKLEAAELVSAIKTLAESLAHNPMQVEKAQPEIKAAEVNAEEPAASDEIKFDVTDVRKAISEYGNKYGIDKAKAILTKFGAERVSALPQEQYEAFINAVAAASMEV